MVEFQESFCRATTIIILLTFKTKLKTSSCVGKVTYNTSVLSSKVQLAHREQKQ